MRILSYLQIWILLATEQSADVDDQRVGLLDLRLVLLPHRRFEDGLERVDTLEGLHLLLVGYEGAFGFTKLGPDLVVDSANVVVGKHWVSFDVGFIIGGEICAKKKKLKARVGF
jgi:hypothetical protein